MQESSQFFEGVLEDFFQNQEGESEFDYIGVQDHLRGYLSRPLNLNQLNPAELEELGLLSEIQMTNFFSYREEFGPFLSIYELQAIPDFDLLTVRRLAPFTTVRSDGFAGNTNWWQIFAKADNEILLRGSRVLETQAGYLVDTSAGATSYYTGTPEGLLLRYRRTSGSKMSIGLTLEKDPGEELLSESSKLGIDFWSAHLYLRDLTPRIRKVVIGDFAPSFGQGLVMFSGFAPGKSAEVNSVKRRSVGLRPYTSVNEFDYLRGAGATIGLGRKFDLTGFVSFRQRDGNFGVADTSNADLPDEFITSLSTSGLHRTPAEIADKNAVANLAGGANLTYQLGSGRLGLNLLHNYFDKPLRYEKYLYNQFRFSGQRLTNGSLDYTWFWKNLHFFGETALSDNGAWTTINGLLVGLGKFSRMSLVQRHFQPEFQSLFGQPFSESGTPANESGWYAGLEFLPAPKWKIAGYLDVWRHPWLRFGVDAPSHGAEWLARLTFTERKKMESYLQLRVEKKERNLSDNTGKADLLTPQTRTQFRWHLSYQLGSGWETRSRVEWAWFDDQFHPAQTGFVIYQDILFRPKLFPISGNLRLAVFRTDSYDTRIYVFENDVLNAFSIPPYYGRGIRTYLNLRYRQLRNLTVELRLARTFRPQEEAIGSGLDAISGNKRTDLRLQVRYTW